MEEQDKLYEQFRKAAGKSEGRAFPAMENVWDRIENKLEHTEAKKEVKLWKKLAVAASILLVVSLGIQFFINDANVAPKVNVEDNPIVVDEPKAASPVPDSVRISKPNSYIKEDAGKLLQQQIKNHASVAVNDTKEEASNEKAVLDDETVAPQVLMNSRASFSNVASSELNKAYLNSQPTKKYTITTEVKDYRNNNVDAIISDEGLRINDNNASKTITGIVSDASGPIPGVNVTVYGTTIGTQTDIDGKYKIEAKKDDVLVFNYVGMEDFHASVGASNTINATLEQGAVAFGDVIVSSAHGIRRPQAAITATTPITMKENTGVVQGLAGKVSGVEVSGAKIKDVRRRDRSINTIKRELKTKLTSMDSIGFKTITGIVSDATGPLPGADVAVVGTTRRTRTDIDGKYQIPARDGDTLVFSFARMQEFRASVGANITIDVALQEGWAKSKSLFHGTISFERAPEASASYYAEKIITGVVSDSMGPIPGVNVTISGSIKGTETDIDGRYAIEAKKGDELVFTFVGMKDYRATVDASNIINVVLQDSDVVLHDIILPMPVIRKREAMYTTQTVNEKNLSKPAVAYKAIKGVVSDATGPISGVTVVVAGTTIVTQTDRGGKFKIYARKGDILIFSYVGMQESSTIVGGRKKINVTLKKK
ncbi:MAG TPA: carboxypeptidase-like regulatory domain-containing protein [Flavobacterium sp.]|jgi:hypothetical protein